MLKSLCAIVAAILALTPATAQQLKKVTVGGTLSATDIGLWVAHKKGYFRDEGIDAEFITFDSAARMIAALGTVLAAGYLLWLYQRTAFGEPNPEFAGGHGHDPHGHDPHGHGEGQ